MKRTRWIVVSLAVAAIGLLAAGVLWFLDGQRPVITAAFLVGTEGERLALPPSLEVVTGPQFVVLGVTLDPPPTREWFLEHLELTNTPVRNIREEGGAFLITLQPDPSGVPIRVTLSGVNVDEAVVPEAPGNPDRRQGSGHALVVTVRREAPFTAALEVLDDGLWRPVAQGEMLAMRPLNLRIIFSNPMDQASVAASLTGYALTWDSSSVARVSFDHPPARLSWRLNWARDTLGRALDDPTLIHPFVRTGEPPAIYVFDPGTGEAWPVQAALPDIRSGSVSADGRWLLATAPDPDNLVESEGELVPGDGWWLIDLTTGERRRLGQPYQGWLDAQTYLESGPWRETLRAVGVDGAVRREYQLPTDWDGLTVSPDGSRLAVLVSRYQDENAEWLAPRDLAIIDLETGETMARVDGFTQLYVPHTDDGSPSGPVWSPDGTTVAAVSEVVGLGADADNVSDVYPAEIRLATITGSSSVGAKVQVRGLGHPTWLPFSWSADGTYWLLANVLVEAKPPYTVTDLPDGWLSASFWSSDGRWLARCHSLGGGPLCVRRMADGAVRVIQATVNCGWDSKGRLYYVP